MTPTEALLDLDKFILTEKRMRELVFKNDAPKRRVKVADCVKALASVEVLRKSIAHEEQGELFYDGV